MGIKERREREKDARREEIINAAEKVFFSKGLAEATMDEVAQQSELSKGTLYLYCKCKEDLYLSVAMKGMEIMHDMFKDAASKSESPVEQMDNIGKAYFKFFEQHREHFRTFYFFESPQFHSQVSPEMLETCAEQDRRVWDVVVTPIRRAIEQGLLHPELDPMEVGVMLWSNMNGLLRLIDRHEKHWKELYGVDLSALIQKSTAFLLEAMLTDKGKKLYSTALLYHDTPRDGMSPAPDKPTRE
jgi:TetR/AcrR family transcriptional regulator